MTRAVASRIASAMQTVAASIQTDRVEISKAMSALADAVAYAVIGDELLATGAIWSDSARRVSARIRRTVEAADVVLRETAPAWVGGTVDQWAFAVAARAGEIAAAGVWERA
mgnify:FL=1